MALDTYPNLKAAIKRIDGSNNINDLLDDAISLTETEIYHNSQEPLRIRAMETRSTASTSISSRFIALPDNYLDMRGVRLVLSGRNKDIRYATPEAMEVTESSGKPEFFTVTSQIEFDRIPDSVYTLEVAHYAKPTGLSSSNSTNAVLTSYPNIYLMGCLAAVNMFNAEEEKSGFYYNAFIGAIRGANKGDKKGRHGPAPTMKTEGMTP